MSQSLDEEFDRVVAHLRAAWESYDIAAFLKAKASLDILLVSHLQAAIDRNVPDRSVKISFDQGAMDKIAALDEKLKILSDKIVEGENGIQGNSIKTQ